MLDVKTQTEQTHYETLRVPEAASRAEIRSSFRRLVKIYHPDKNPKRTEWAETRMREVLEAYRGVSDEQHRLAYDRGLRSRRNGLSFVERLTQRADDFGAQSKLVLHYLLQGDPDEAGLRG